MKFIHTADIHLDSPLSGLSAYQGAPTALLRTATRDAFTRLVDVAIEDAVDFMVIAGDLYDGTWKDYNTGHFFCREMGRLHQSDIPVYVLFGNHDADSEMTKKLQLPPNVHTFDSRKASTFCIDTLKVALHGRSYKEAATLDNLAASYPQPTAGWLNIGVLHTALEGYAAHARYAPCSVAELSAKGYDYWALGHVHEHAILQTAPWVVFPGNLQGRSIRETGPRGAVMVTADSTGIRSVERLLVDGLRWQLVEVDASTATTLTDVVTLVGQAFARLLAEVPDGIFVAARVCIQGRSAAHGALFGLALQLREEIVAQAAGQGVDRLWVEKVQLQTEPLSHPTQASEHTEALSDLAALLAGALDDEALLQSLRDDLRPLMDKAPLELFGSVAQLEALRQGHVADLIRTASPNLLALLAQAR